MRPGPRRLRDRRLDDQRRLVEHRREASRRALRALECLGGDGQRRDELERGEGDQRDDSEEHAVETARVHCADPERERRPHRHPRAEHDEAGAHSRRVRARCRDSSELTVVLDHPLHLRVDRAECHEVGSALEQVDHRRRELAASGRPAGFVALGQRPRHPRHHDRGEQERDRHDERSGRQHDRSSAIVVATPTTPAMHHAGSTRRPTSCRASTSSTTRVEQVAAMERCSPDGVMRSSRSYTVTRRSSEGPERSVVTDEALAVAEQAAGEGEEPHADHGEAEVGDRAVLRAA